MEIQTLFLKSCYYLWRVQIETLLTEWFTQLKGQHVDVSVPQRGYKMDMIKMAHENAETFLEERRRQWQHQIDKTGGAIKKLAEILDLPRLPERMECFDISPIHKALKPWRPWLSLKVASLRRRNIVVLN